MKKTILKYAPFYLILAFGIFAMLLAAELYYQVETNKKVNEHLLRSSDIVKPHFLYVSKQKRKIIRSKLLDQKKKLTISLSKDFLNYFKSDFNRYIKTNDKLLENSKHPDLKIYELNDTSTVLFDGKMIQTRPIMIKRHLGNKSDKSYDVRSNFYLKTVLGHVKLEGRNLPETIYLSYFVDHEVRVFGTIPPDTKNNQPYIRVLSIEKIRK